jgi:hypothetical protein
MSIVTPATLSSLPVRSVMAGNASSPVSSASSAAEGSRAFALGSESTLVSAGHPAFNAMAAASPQPLLWMEASAMPFAPSVGKQQQQQQLSATAWNPAVFSETNRNVPVQQHPSKSERMTPLIQSIWQNPQGPLQALAQQGVSILSGDCLPTVKTYLKEKGAVAAYLSQDALQHSDAKAYIENSLQASGQALPLGPCLLVQSETLPKDVLLHELVHWSADQLRQQGQWQEPPVEAALTTPEVSHQVLQLWTTFHEQQTSWWGQFSKTMGLSGLTENKTLATASVEKPSPIQAATLTATSPQTTLLTRAIHHWMGEEMEACAFVAKEGPAYGISEKELQQNQKRLALYQQFLKTASQA